MDNKQILLVCDSGHVLAAGWDATSRTSPRCGKCGKTARIDCPKCQTMIEGYYDEWTFKEIPYYCTGCGFEFPWSPSKLVENIKMTATKPTEKSNRIFVVHGHDDAMKLAVERVLERLELTSVILHRQPNGGKTLIEKFETYSDVGFALILMSPDDVAFKKGEEYRNASVTPTLRARQNVIFEHGFFVGKIGRKNVVVLRQSEVEKPGDYDGVVYEAYDNPEGAWRLNLVTELQEAGYAVSADMLLPNYKKSDR